MKKLIIAACAIALGVCAQAATSNWTFNAGSTALLGTDGEALSGASVYMIAAGTISNENLVKAFRAADFNILNYAYTGYLQNEDGYDASKSTIVATTDGDGKILAADGIFYQDDRFAVNAGDKFYAAVVYGDYIYVSGNTVTKKAANLPTVTQVTVNLGSSDTNFGTADFDGAGWYKTAAVPEPTSGLLLLLGVAGLALRRRRA